MIEHINKIHLSSLLDEVVLKCKHPIILKNIQSDSVKHKRCYAKLARFLAFLSTKDRKNAQLAFKDLADELLSNGLKKEDIKEFLDHVFDNYKKWLKRIVDIELEKKKNEFYELCDKYVQNDEIEDEEDFLFIADEGVSDEIHNMHYTQEEKISAAEYFSQHPIDTEDMDSIIDKKEELIKLLNNHNEFSEEFIDELKVLLLKLNTTLTFAFATAEFKDIGIGLANFIRVLDEVKNEQSEDMKDVLFHLVQNFVEDLIKWLDHVFIEQDAIDIHYLDANLLANAEQIAVICGGG
ncbi:MAG: hypothetical protein GXO40_00390, partial [Epsilonproteobacteria bacterium]|nr:hypothetical protein [Campylobacterota bacterium]